MSDIKKVRDYKKSRQPKPEITAAEHRANAEIVVNSLMPVIEKMTANPADIQPVAETFDDLLFEMRNGNQETTVRNGRQWSAGLLSVMTWLLSLSINLKSRQTFPKNLLLIIRAVRKIRRKSLLQILVKTK